MKTLLLLGAVLAVLGAAIVRMSAQSASASPAATISPHRTPAGALPSPRPTPTARPHATRSQTTPSAATSSPSAKRQRAGRVSPAATASPSGGAQLEGEPSSSKRESPSKGAGPGETSKVTPSKPHRKLERPETNTPPPEASGEQR
jgi:hypothetical protein